MAESPTNEGLEKPNKMPRLMDNNSTPDCESIQSFEGFEIKQILKESPENKLFAVEGVFKQGTDTESSAVVVLEKTHFTSEDISKILTDKTSIKCIFQNDVYGNFLCYPPVEFNSVKATIIHPATAKHISKFSAKTAILIEETAEIYKSVTLPHIQESKFDNQVMSWKFALQFLTADFYFWQWVYNILEHKKEADRIVFEDPDPINGFILIPDLKWDCRTISNLYLTGIVFARDIKSLRDLTADHLPLLNNILVNGSVRRLQFISQTALNSLIYFLQASISEKYGVPASQLRIYIHYQPSYYHLHVHFTSLQFRPLGNSIFYSFCVF